MKWFIPFVAIAAATLLLLAAHSSLAAVRRPASSRSMASKGITCSHGDFKASGESQYEVRQKVANLCFDKYMNRFSSQRGGLPAQDQADMLIEDCVNNTVCK